MPHFRPPGLLLKCLANDEQAIRHMGTVKTAYMHWDSSG
jgi:hypothetical protein